MNTVIMSLEKYDLLVSEKNQLKKDLEIANKYRMTAEKHADELKKTMIKANFYHEHKDLSYAFCRYQEMREVGITDDELRDYMKSKKVEDDERNI